MWKKNKGIVLFLIIFIAQFSFGQTTDQYYKRKLNGVTDQWHKIMLPLDTYSKVSNDLSDVRIYGLLQNGDTLEIPYKVQIPETKVVTKELPFRLINSAAKSGGYYFTFEMVDQAPVSEILLSFSEQNYDWKIKVEGSQDLKEWFTMVDDYRILSIKNGVTDYQFGKLVFPPSKYQYYRFFVKSKEKPTLLQAKVLASAPLQVALSHRSSSFKITENKKDKNSEIDIHLSSHVPVSEIVIYGDKRLEFYRPFELKILRDSSKLVSGKWTYHFGSVMTGTLSSFDDNHFLFDNTWTKALKLTVYNHDNAPLKIDSIRVSGPDYQLIGRYDDKNISYFLVYGDKRLLKPTYDITHFATPDSVVSLDLGDEEILKIDALEPTPPLFENKWWLWVLMITIILILGGFTMKMMKGTS
jgi:Protein of unknown function (DUF3999)